MTNEFEETVVPVSSPVTALTPLVLSVKLFGTILTLTRPVVVVIALGFVIV